MFLVAVVLWNMYTMTSEEKKYALFVKHLYSESHHVGQKNEKKKPEEKSALTGRLCVLDYAQRIGRPYS